jgi:ElaB/YqjD/DUF883 family membrane-anchored ribosome-binding protein
MTTTRTRSAEADTPNIAEQAADSASSAIRATQDVANSTLNRMNDGVESARNRVSPVVDRWSAQAETAMQRSIEAMRDTTNQLRDQATRVSDATAVRVREEPLKSILLAAAAGAALMALVNLFSHARRDGPR